jgi:transcriptional regulator with XRE-family HTH domain
MPKKSKAAPAWRQRVRAALKAKQLSLAMVAERMELSEPTIRHWMNGTREPNFSDLLRLFAVCDLDPQATLFEAPAAAPVTPAEPEMTPEEIADAIKAMQQTESGQTIIAILRSALVTKPVADKKVKRAYYGKNDPRKVARYSRPTLFNDSLTGPRK